MASKGHIPGLDGLRAVAVGLVLLGHTLAPQLFPGGFGVTIFFFLSGYLITTLIAREVDQTSGFNLRKFYLRRCLRILPPMFLLLIVAWSVALLFGWRFTGAAFAYQAAFLANVFQIMGGKGAPGTGILWSLAIEEHYYFIFPLIAGACFLKRRDVSFAKGILWACVVILAWRMWLRHVCHVSDIRLYQGSDTRFDSILFGAFLAVWDRCPELWARLRGFLGKPLAVGVGLMVIAVTLLYRNPHFREVYRYSLQGLALIPLFHWSVYRSDALGFRFLSWGWVRYLGKISYCLYLFHFLVFYSVRWMLEGKLSDWVETPAPLVFRLQVSAISIAITIVISAIVREMIEKPLEKVRKRLHA